MKILDLVPKIGGILFLIYLSFVGGVWIKDVVREKIYSYVLDQIEMPFVSCRNFGSEKRDWCDSDYVAGQEKIMNHFEKQIEDLKNKHIK